MKVPAIYLLTPTNENIGRLVQDFKSNLYDEYFINFDSTISRQMLEDLANASVQTGCFKQVKQIFDQYIHFASLEDDLFSLELQHSFTTCTSSSTTDSEIEKFVSECVNGLFSVFVTLGKLPQIKSSQQGASETIASSLCTKLKRHIANAKENLFIEESKFGIRKTSKAYFYNSVFSD